MSCRTKAKLWLTIYWANTALLLYGLVRFILTDAPGLDVTTPVMGAAVGVLVSMTVTPYWQQAGIVPPPGDTPADANDTKRTGPDYPAGRPTRLRRTPRLTAGRRHSLVSLHATTGVPHPMATSAPRSQTAAPPGGKLLQQDDRTGRSRGSHPDPPA